MISVQILWWTHQLDPHPIYIPSSLRTLWENHSKEILILCLSIYAEQLYGMLHWAVILYHPLSFSSKRSNKCLYYNRYTVKIDSFFNYSLSNLFLACKLFIEISKVFFIDHLTNWNQKFFKLLKIKNSIVIAIEK